MPTTGYYYWNINDYAEPTGRFFGMRGGTDMGYRVIKERRQIQMSDGFGNSNIILMYISDGQSMDNASQIDVQAFQTIRAYQDWKRSPQAAIKDSYEAATYYNERRLLRAIFYVKVIQQL
jgi:hypothetical protein